MKIGEDNEYGILSQIIGKNLSLWIENGIIDDLWYKRKIDQIINPENCELCILREYVWIDRILKQEDLFVPYYQWIRNNESWIIDKFEALIRYIDGKRILLPNNFIDIAKKNNLLLNLSVNMINNVLKEMTMHKNDISLNLEWEISNNEVINLIFSYLDWYNINPNRLTIEVLETINFDINTEKYKNMISNIKRLKENGIKISLDDYWAWYSNILRVLDIMPDIVKIDWNLIKNIDLNNNLWNLVEVATLVYLMHRSWKKVIAEHIENQKIQDKLLELNVDYSQWFLYSKPSRDIIKS